MSQIELKQISSVQFGVWNPEELTSLSVCEVTSTGTYDNGLPVVNGLLDQRMGVTDRGLKCLTCKMDEEQCPGHFGHITLSVPIVHVGFADTVLQVLRCVCFNCSKLLISPYGAKEERYNQIIRIQHPQKRLQAFANECVKNSRCEGSLSTESYRTQQLQAREISTGSSGCNCTQPTYKRVGFRLSRQFNKITQKKNNTKNNNEDNNNNDNNENDIVEQADLSGTEILEILSRISDETVTILGFNARFAHPKWLITTVLPVPPPQVRPSVTFNGSDRSADDITVCLVAILKTNAAIAKARANSATDQAIQHDIDKLTTACAQLVNNEQGNTPQMTSKSGKILKTLRQRVVGKGGRIRSNLMGKRVNFCARTVITGDPNLGIDFVGVPRWIARTLTYPEVVTKFNKERLQELVRRGPELYPGAQRVIKPDGSIIHLKYAAKTGDIVLQFGYIVERHIVDNDFILFNRQPSLHKMSLMGHKAKIMPYSSFRLNLSCTSPYNADFDGDEMNLHVAQTPLLRAEIAELMLSPRQIVSPQASKPVMGIVQDSLLGVSRFTRRDTFCDRNLTNNLLMCVDTWNGEIPHPAILKPIPLWTGKQIFSLIIPRGINMHRGSKHRPKADKDTNMSFSDATVLISNGQLISGIVDANTVGKTEAGIIHLIWLERGWDDTRQFMTTCQKLVNNWLVTHSFSVGIYDLMANPKTLQKVKDLVDESMNAVEDLIVEARAGRMKRKPGHSVVSTFEANVNERLGQAIQKTGAAVQEQLTRDNSINAMVYAGSKGSHLNISQIVACVGQQNISGKRVPFNYRRRTLPHFLKDDLGASSRGFVSSSYIKGLNPVEFVAHAGGGREGIIDTAVKTAETGYIQRRLVKSLESIKVHYDATVRNSLGDIIQFVYGEDGMDGSYIEKQTMDHVGMDNNSMVATYHFDLKQTDLLNTLCTDNIKEEVLQDIDAESILTQELRQLINDRDFLRDNTSVMKLGDSNVRLPCNLARIILSAQQKFNIKLEGGVKERNGVIRLDLGQRSDLSPLYIIRQVEELLQRLIVVPGKTVLSLQAQTNAITLFSIFLRQCLSSKRVLGEFHLNKNSFDYVINEVESRFKQALVHPGEMVGAIAAQSIGEPATQMTLNTFHLAGVAAKNASSGVPRLVEIINVARNVKMKGMCIELSDKKKATNEKDASDVLNQLEYTRICDISESVEIYHDPIPTECIIEEDRDVVDNYLALPDDDFEYESSSPWLLRIILNSAVAIGKKIEPSKVASMVNTHFKNLTGSAFKIKCIASLTHQENVKSVLHIRISRSNQNYENIDINNQHLLLQSFQGNENDEDIELKFLYQVKDVVLDHIKLCGITDITKIFLSKRAVKIYDKQTGGLITIPEDKPGGEYWYFDTEGTNLKEVITHQDVDHTSCYSNFCPDMLPVCGIEATRASILKELRGVIEADGSHISYRHLAMLVDIMTFKGAIMSITRHGFNRLQTGPLMRCSFEESVEILMEAAAFAEYDPLAGISEQVMMGKLANIGTGSFDVVLDVDALMKAGKNDNNQIYDTNATSTEAQASFIDYNDVDFNSIGLHDNHGDLSHITWGTTGGPQSSSYLTSSNYHNAAAQSSSYLSAASSSYSAVSSRYSPTSSNTSPTSGSYNSRSIHSGSYSPSSSNISPTSMQYTSPTSGSYSPTSAAYSPTSGAYSPTSAAYSPTSASYSPTSGSYSPTSGSYSPTSGSYSPTSASYSPTSGSYSPTSASYDAAGGGAGGAIAATSGSYSPSSPTNEPNGNNGNDDPNQAGGPTSGTYSPSSAAYSPHSASYSPQSTSYAPQTSYSPTSPSYDAQ